MTPRIERPSEKELDAERHTLATIYLYQTGDLLNGNVAQLISLSF
ncbi:MAG: hypothetical protein OJF59_002441 [Cytophagales bacterium]|jgi:hypothetical protein|nr:MAG: hypothetical protein OJF59_002441 [Cytophagales bacterium]